MNCDLLDQDCGKGDPSEVDEAENENENENENEKPIGVGSKLPYLHAPWSVHNGISGLRTKVCSLPRLTSR